MTSRSIKVELFASKDCKHTVKYKPLFAPLEDRAPVPNVYVRRDDLTQAFGSVPSKISVTIESE